MIHNIILITSAMGLVAFGGLAFLQADAMVTESYHAYITYADAYILMLASFVSAIFLSLIITEVTQ